MSKEPKKWLDKYPILDDDHVHGLEARAALNEWAHKLPRHEAEAEAHKDYIKDQLTEGASHHYLGMKTAHAAGDTDSALKHGIMYKLALNALGHKDTIKPPPEVENKAKHTPSKGLYKFKYHPSDSLLLQDNQESKTDENKN